MRRALVAIVIASIIVGCGGVAPGGDAVDGAGRKLADQSFQPPYPVGPPGGRTIHIDRASIDAGHTVLTVEFVGSDGYLESDHCSEDYAAWVGGMPEQLEVAIVEVDHLRFSLGHGCLGLGHFHKYHLTLPSRYDGAEVLDRSGATLLVGPPGDVATLASVPDGWELVHGEPNCCGGEPPVWAQVYSASPIDGPPIEGAGRLVLYQAFGISGEWDDLRTEKSEGRGGHPESVTFHGQPAQVWVDDVALDELLLAWNANGRSYGLIGNLADMSAEDLVGYAESLEVSRP